MSAAPSTPADGYDAGGIIPAGFVVPRATLRPEPQLSPEQVATFERLLELMKRWESE